MSFSMPIQWHHYHVDPIWPDGTFKGGGGGALLIGCKYQIEENQNNNFPVNRDSITVFKYTVEAYTYLHTQNND
jgi:hypothetical protein